MSILSDKYKIPQDTVKKMINDGTISCVWAAYEEVFSLSQQGLSHQEIAYRTGRSKSGVTHILNRVKKC